MDNNLIVQTPNGYTIKLKRKELTWGEKKQVNEILSRSFTLSPVSLRDFETSKGDAIKDAKVTLDPTVNQQATELVFSYLVESITTPSGEVIVKDFLNWLNNQLESIGAPIFQAFNTAIIPAQPSGEKNS